MTQTLKAELDAQVDRVLEGNVLTAAVTARFVTPYVGGQPASEKGVRAYVEHHLHLAPDTEAFESAVKRILGEEVRKDGPEDELKEEQVYGLNVIRRNDLGAAWIGTWQIRAMVKQAASRLGLFTAKGKVGSKGDLAEGMLVRPIGNSDAGEIQQVLIQQADGQPYTQRVYEKFMGSVGTPRGRKSIVVEAETAPVGSLIEFELGWPSKKIKADDMKAILGFAQRVGLGSTKAFERGRFEIDDLQIE